MQWMAMVMTYFFGRKNRKTKNLKEMAIEIFEEVSYQSRKVVTLTLTGLGAVIFFCGGFFITLLDSTSQYDQAGYVSWTATLLAGVGLILMATLVFAGVFLRAWPKPSQHRHTHPREEEAAHRQPSAIEGAIAALIMDYVKEREHRRETKMHTSTETHDSHHEKNRPEQYTPPLH